MPQISNSLWTGSNRDGQEDDLISQGDGDVNHADRQNDADISGSSSQLTDQAKEAKPVYTSQWATLIIIVNVTVGAGLLAMPFAMQTSGIVASMLFQLVFLILTVITGIMCIELTVKSEVRSYHEIVEKHCHPFLYKFTQVSIFVLTFGVVVAYMVLIGDQSDRILASLYGPKFCQNWYMNRRFIMVISTMFILKPLCSARSVDFLKYASFLGLVATSFILYVVADNFKRSTKIAPDAKYYPTSWSDIASILPVFCLAYQCHLSLVPTVASIPRHDKPKAFITTSIAMTVCMFIYSATSILSVLTFGAAIEKDLTESFPGKSWSTLAAIGIVGIKCAMTLPAVFLPARLSIVDLLTNNWKRFANLSEPVKRIGTTVVFLDCTLMLAIFVPNILVVVNLLGCTAVMLIFSIPGLAYISLVKQNRGEKQRASGLSHDTPLIFTAKDRMKLGASYFMIVFGILMTVVVFYISFIEMLASTSAPPLCQV